MAHSRAMTTWNWIWTLGALMTIATATPLNHLKYPHAYATNEWWRLMNATAYNRNYTNCYVCSHMPVAAHNSGLRPYNVRWTKSWCLYGLSTHPGRGKLWQNSNFSQPLKINWAKTPITRAECTPNEDLVAWPQLSVALPEVLMLTHLPRKAFPACVVNNGSREVGKLPHMLCNSTFSYCPRQNETKCMYCLQNPTCAKNSTLQEAACAMTNRSLPLEDGSQSYCSRIAPGPKGTRVLTDWYFVCGHKAYVSLPPDWNGLCTIASLSDHVFFMQRTSTTSRHRREVTERVEDVPKEWRIWGTGEKIGQSLFPWVGVGLVRDHVEINRYALLRLINATRTLGKGTSRELSALRAMVMQNRVVLDLLAAPQGGVCKIIGQTCCTFIPDENGDGGSIHTALSDLDTLQQYVERQTPGGNLDWLSWLTTGAWWQILLKVLVPPGVILLLFCLFFSCIVPCLRKMMTNVFISAFYQYTLVQGELEGETEDQI
ncbi:syncytin-2-like [Archocentrus centrarchus]|uniref:syncytin-2-like n=1 Tax=Archocentrus centrarchus TaxID=63155 RepID=UPI0011E9FBA6|nr:syncytin-2-like [Archocentrus centrarchus]XP_030576498.1 syncytin-2-like [Archocentrus centrarchus]XP_030576499.1 syncytin-2-like [Archocentrus centrarchus]XP_030576500.1 syncytin-2-like [Archocentrus centrarchus]